MKKILLGLLLGFMLHKGLATIYNYSWWANEELCRFESSLDCIYEKMGPIKYLKYVLLEPNYTFQ